MADENESQPWPVWGRVVFGIVFLAVIALAAVLAAQGGRFDASGVRIVISVLLVGLLVGVVSAVARLFTGRTETTLVRSLRHVEDSAAEPPASAPLATSARRALTSLGRGDVEDALRQVDTMQPDPAFADQVAAVTAAQRAARSHRRARRTARATRRAR